jgi:predicted regulator of Ras-like GTPase activity (Roadblock/LC7/MglB family)
MRISPARGEEIARVLEGAVRDGGFSLAVLGDLEGFPVASAAAPGENADSKAAAMALVQRSATQARAQLGLGATDEILLNDDRGRRLVCRPLRAGENELILVVLIPERRQSYRLITSRALRDVRRIFETVGE